MNPYKLQIPDEVERKIDRCRTSMRAAIRKHLQEIVEGATKRLLPAKKTRDRAGPPLRFYVFEGYRVSYQINPITRSVLVLALRPETG